ncbi:uncharacterized protein KY384_004539 [Bacidia gigantensis]|uniref:uncharacterized protein n=1 Tax=Bacidia gigantensis TaxID=2732470 RepID=UPI001D05B3B3|nr:uncharacterized protein KY384_004539 [Bacidia gigantensis]KAG8531181.1 hypothetical protein KY384_004539 [Bacidia gigantensis]
MMGGNGTPDESSILSWQRWWQTGLMELLQVLVGKVKGKMAILIDDMCDTAGTLCKAATTVKEYGAAEVLAMCTHGILSGKAIDNLNGCDALSKVVVTNTVPLQGKDKLCPKLTTINIAPTLSEAIRRTHNGESVSFLFTHAPVDSSP